VYDLSNIAMSITCSMPFTIVGGSFGTQLLSRSYTQTANAYRFAYVPVNGVDMLYLASPNFSSLDIVGPSGAHDTLMCAVVTQPYGSVMDASMPYDSWFRVPAMTTQTLSFSLRDRSYNLMAMVPNISFTLLLD